MLLHCEQCVSTQRSDTSEDSGVSNRAAVSHEYTLKNNVMVVPSDKAASIKMAGYLDKRGKMKVVCRWKRWWFTLEGRLLLYYKSQQDCLRLSPCRGSLNMGLASSVRLAKGLKLQVTTRSQTVTLRASNMADRDQWLQALSDAMAMPNSSLTLYCTRPVQHFRYSRQAVSESHVNNLGRLNCRGAAGGSKRSRLGDHSCEGKSTRFSALESRTRLTGMAKCVSLRYLNKTLAFSDTAIPSHFDGNMLCRCESRVRSLNDFSKSSVGCNGPRSERIEVKQNSSVTKSGVDRVRQNCETEVETSSKCNVLNIGTNCASSSAAMQVTAVNVTDLTTLLGEVHTVRLGVELNQDNNVVSSDTVVSLRARGSRYSKSCDDISLDSGAVTPQQPVGAVNEEVRLELEMQVSGSEGRKKRSDSEVMNDEETMTMPQQEWKGTLRKRSVSFLRKIWKRPEKKLEEVALIESEARLVFVKPSMQPAVDNSLQNRLAIPPSDSICDQIMTPLSENLHDQLMIPLSVTQPNTEPAPDYEGVAGSPTGKEEVPLLPPRHRPRTHSPYHDVPTNNRPIRLESPPVLPIKMKRHIRQEKHNDFTAELINSGTNPVSCGVVTPTTLRREQRANDLDALLAALCEEKCQLLGAEGASHQMLSAGQEDPDYDVPRPHALLLRPPNSNTHDPLPATHFFGSLTQADLHLTDSLDTPSCKISRLNDITPDSLECCAAPWSLDASSEEHLFEDSLDLASDLNIRIWRDSLR